MCERSISLVEYDKHISTCYRVSLNCLSDRTIIKLPEDNGRDNFMKFENYKNKIVRPFLVCADIECTLKPTYESYESDIESSSSSGDTKQKGYKTHIHVPNSACFYFMSEHPKLKSRMWIAYGEDCVRKMIVELSKIAEECIDLLKENQKMEMTKEDNGKYYSAKCCHICNKNFDDGGEDNNWRVRDHDHLTGKFRGAAHNKCNINYFLNRFLPVVMHNLKGYDGHIILKNAHEAKWGMYGGSNYISAIPTSLQQYMSITIGSIRFIDSYQFMKESLSKLTENLYEENGNDKYINFPNMKTFYNGNLPLLCQKGYYPYEWFDDESKFDHVGLPPREAFYSTLTQEMISEEAYEHAWNVYKTLGCKTFREYHELYLKSDVLLLCDIFQNFRETCISYYKLDPANYFTAPGLSWDALLLTTKIELELITDPKVLDLIERHKRGGLCFVGSKRHVAANNIYVADYDPSKPSNYLIDFDANSLYGGSMSKPLPYRDLILEDDITLSKIVNTDLDAKRGYIVECDLHFPRELHGKFKEFPPCPELLTPSTEWFSEYQMEVAETTGLIKNGKYRGSAKLVPHLFDHVKYVIHYRNLKFIIGLGVVVTKIHQVLSFSQKPWMKPYIDFNTKKRQEAKNEFEKDFFKLMINSVFGKTMENVGKRVSIKLTTDEDKACKYFSNHFFKSCNYKNLGGLYVVEFYKEKVLYNKPVYVGTSILDISKECMMNFHYNVIHETFKTNYNLLYSDTDSLIYSIQHDDIYEWIKNNKQYFDLSDSLRPDLKDNTNKKVYEKMKDELKSLPMTDFVALNPKTKSFKYQKLDDTKKIIIANKKTLKGVSTVVVDKNITHEDYERVRVTNIPLHRDIVRIESKDHQLYTIVQPKVALTSFYDKMKLMNANDCIPYGYNPI